MNILDKFSKAFNMLRFTLLITIIYVFFHEFFELIISRFFVNPFLSKFDTSILSDILWLGSFFSVLLLAYRRYKHKYFIGYKLLIICILALCIYFYYRFYGDIWIFIKSPRIKSLAYLDIIPIFLISLIISYPVSRLRRKDVKIKLGFNQDYPLGETGKDLLNREGLAKHIADELINTNTENNSFAIGISSEWGFGKTSFIDLIKRQINKDNNIIIEFNPWSSHNSKSIIKDFFHSLNSKLRYFNSDISSYLENYYELLLNLDETKSNKVVNSIIRFTRDQSDRSTEYNDVDRAVKSINKKIVIFIDDLDRLYKFEIIEILKLIRNSANFSNFIFIVTYDKNYIISAIKKLNNYYPEFFLEKIFQIEIQLPKFDSTIIQIKLLELLSPKLEIEDQNTLKDILSKKRRAFGPNCYFLDILTTIRDVTRFVNSFQISYSFLKNNIVLIDLLNLEALRLKFPSVYKLVFFNPTDFLETKPDEFKKARFILRKEKINQNGQEIEKIIINKYLEKNCKTLGVPEDKIESVITLLHSLFPDPGDIFIKSGNELLSVRNPVSFERYSHYRLLDSDLSEIDFSKARSMDLTTFQNKISEWSDQNLKNDLRRKFESISSYYDREDYEKIIQAIFYFARLRSKSESIFDGFDYENLYTKISDYDNSISSKYYETKEELRSFITTIFESAPTPYLFESEFIFQTLDKYSISYNFIIPKDNFEAYRIEYFRNYLKLTPDLDINVWHLYHLCDIIDPKPLGNGSYEIHKLKNPKASSYFIEFIKEKSLDEFLRAVIKKEPFHDNLFAVSEIIPQMFETYEKFGLFLESFDKSKFRYLDEFLSFYKKFSETNYSKYIEYKFNIMPSNEYSKKNKSNR